MKKKFLGLELSEVVIISAVFSVIFSFLLFFLIDLRNIFGFRDILLNTDRRYFFFGYQPFFFQHWGRNGGFAEIIQYFLLGFGVLVSAYVSGLLFKSKKRLSRFWLIMSIALLLMLLQDAGEMRHVPMSYVQWIFDEVNQGIAGTLVEFAYFAVLGGLPLYALIKYWKDIKVYAKTKYYLLVGFAFYFLAGSLSFWGTAFQGLLQRDFYSWSGEKFYNLALRFGDCELKEIWAESSFNIEFFLMDSLLEENIEIIGAAALLSAIVSFYIVYRRSKKF